MIFLTGLMGPVGQLGAVGWQHRGMLSEVLRDPHEANFLGQVAWKLLVADGLVILALNEWLVLGQAYLNHPNFQESQFQIHKLNHCRVFETYHRSLLVLPWQFLGAAFVSGAWFQQTRCDQDHTMGWKPLRLTGLPARMEHGFQDGDDIYPLVN